MTEYEPILKYWLSDDLSLLKTDKYAPRFGLWFSSKKETDDYIKEKFEKQIIAASNGSLDHWKNDAQGYVALIILLDQFTRNVFRGSAQMFAYDSKALSIAKEFASNNQKFNQVSAIEQLFIYLCYTHSENQNDLLEAIDAMKKISENGSEAVKSYANGFHKFAIEHYDVLKKFNRYPHRNELLGRQSTDAEIEYLKTDKFGGQVKKN